ncbi:hypothetical protein HGRIS_006974 [Hohenbuehelia grisea]|uniref:Pseudouridine synthase I TruA alpha/beta domain-containing protein n=1 Tax=Hohenbuehelia grisea TaxID=104357 RepID=A0ABR3JAM8_9AGAR
MTNPASSYENWTREELIARLTQLDSPRVTRDSDSKAPAIGSSKRVVEKSFDFAGHPKRKIALKFCYSGWEYNGLAHQLGPTPLPTVEGTLFEALAQARLVDPEGGFDGCGFERCGRTDRGVSAAGQVVSLWVRSALKAPETDSSSTVGPSKDAVNAPDASDEPSTFDDDLFGSLEDLTDTANTSISAHPTKVPSELRYVPILNRLLPPTIRILAWSPVDPSFSSRFACQFRHYKYFFAGAGLDIERVRSGAQRLLGEHDFRNLCKLDPAKQITNFRRKILRADVSRVEGVGTFEGRGGGEMYVFDLVGTAFLYHQVRHIMAILFLVGSGLEEPAVVSALLNVAPGLEEPRGDDGTAALPVVESKPEYQMADGLPLMLWDCGYADTDVHWQTDADPDPDAPPHAAEALTKSGFGSNLFHELDAILARSRTHTILDAHFLAAAARHHSTPPQPLPLSESGLSAAAVAERYGTLAYALGGGTVKRTAKYVQLLQRKRLDKVEVANERWRVAKGTRKDERRKVEGEDGEDE